jgi:uncharacterized membrane protein YeaQ/YmgE (transglycosylase-associated protein family)
VGYRYGEDYLILGYLPGHEAALAALGRDLAAAFPRDFILGRPLSETSLGRQAKSLREAALIVSFTAEGATARRWVEQIQSRYQAPLALGVSALTAPEVLPYVRSGQVRGLVAGLVGAAHYEALAGQHGPARRGVEAQSLALALIALLVLVANLALFLPGRDANGT